MVQYDADPWNWIDVLNRHTLSIPLPLFSLYSSGYAVVLVHVFNLYKFYCEVPHANISNQATIEDVVLM